MVQGRENFAKALSPGIGRIQEPRPRRTEPAFGTAGDPIHGLGKKTGQICWRDKLSVSDLESSSLAGFFALIWSNLCTRHIPDKLAPRGHHDWPDKRVTRQRDGDGSPGLIPPALSPAESQQKDLG